MIEAFTNNGLSQCNSMNFNLPTFPAGESCILDDKTYTTGQDFNEMRRYNLERIESEYNRILGEPNLNEYERHTQIVCLLNKLMDNVIRATEINATNYNKLSNKQNIVDSNKSLMSSQESVISKNEDSSLVTKYRNETSESRNNKLKMEFLIYVVLIIIFLVVEGILFFV